MLSSSQSLSSLSAALPLGLGIRERRTGRQRGFIPLCRPVFLFAAGVQIPVNCGIIKTDEPRTLDFSGVRGFLVTNVCIVQRSAA